MELATRTQRLFAALVDFTVSAVLFLAAVHPLVPEPLQHVAAAALLAATVWQVRLLARRGQTLGKRLAGIRIALRDGGGNGGFVVNVLKRGLLSALLNFVPGYLLLDCLLIFREDRRCLHDLIAGTVVVQAGEDA